MGYDYRLLDTGKVIATVKPESISHAKRKMKRMMLLTLKDKRRKRDVDVYFKSWKASLRFGNTHKLIEAMNKWYQDKWKEIEDMKNSIIEKIGMEIGQAKDVENVVAEADNNKAFQDYIIACDHPELLPEEEDKINE